MKGFIKLHRKILKSKVWRDVNACRLFTFCILEATHTHREHAGISLKPGQLVKSHRDLADALSYTENGKVKTPSLSTISRCLKALVKDGRILIDKVESLNDCTLITIVNYAFYQISRTPPEHVANNNNNGGNVSNVSGKSVFDSKTSSRVPVQNPKASASPSARSFKKSFVLPLTWEPGDFTYEALADEGFPKHVVKKRLPDFIAYANAQEKPFKTPALALHCWLKNSQYTQPDKRPKAVQIVSSQRFTCRGRNYNGEDFTITGDTVTHKKAGFSLPINQCEVVKP